jgi:hypothetical protein
MLFMGGSFTLINGLVALTNSRFYVAGTVFVFGDLRTWGWILTGLGIVELVAAGVILLGQEWGRWFGIAVAVINAIGHLLFLAAYPWWSVLTIGLDIIVIYALVAYGTAV